jgi:hypothetical protein
MSKAIKKLNKAHSTYDLNVEVVSGPANQVTTKAFITIFKEIEGKGSVITKKATGYGIGATLDESQQVSIEEAVKHLGL